MASPEIEILPTVAANEAALLKILSIITWAARSEAHFRRNISDLQIGFSFTP
jgi:hypothetical protein